MSKKAANKKRSKAPSRNKAALDALPPTPSHRKLITKLDEARRYAVSPRTIDNWVKDGVISCIKIGNKFLRFDPELTDREVARFKIEAAVID